MTQKQRLFIEIYKKTKNATESAKIAGYSQRTAYSSGQRLLKDVEVAKLIEEGFEELKRKYDISKDDYIKRTILLHEEAKHPSTRQRYWELLGKIYGYTKEVVEVVGIKPTNVTNLINTQHRVVPKRATNQHIDISDST